MNEARQGNKFLLRCREIKLQCPNHQKLSYNNIISYIFKLIKKKKMQKVTRNLKQDLNEII